MTAHGSRSARRTSSAALFVAVLALAWAVLVMATGGIDARIAGVPIRSHDVLRPLLVSGGAFVVSAALIRAGGFFLPHRPIVGALAAAVFLYALGWGTCAATGADAYGYLSQARLWRDGLPIVAQPWAMHAPWPLAAWTFTPLGYRPVDGPAIAPAYAVGLPLIMAGVERAAGYDAVFWIVPAAGALLVAATYALGRALASSRVGLTAAFLVATNATLIGEVAVPMSDVVLAAALTTGCWLLFRQSEPRSAAAGIACAAAVVVRPNLAPTVLLLGVWLAARPWLGAAVTHGAAWRQASLFLLCAATGFLVPAWANWRFFGSPFESGYGTPAAIYDAARIPANLAAYLRHVVGTRAELALVGLAALLFPRLWPTIDRSIRAAIAVLIASVVLQYLAYEFPTNPGYLRFLLPCLPFAMIGVARLGWRLARTRWAAAAVAIVMAVAATRSLYGTVRDGGFDLRIERKYAGAAAMTAERTEPASVVLSMQHSGSVRYYAGRMSLRYDWLDPAWLDRAVDFLSGRGHPVYALLDGGEVDVVRRRFAGQRRVEAFASPISVYRGAGVVYLFDLTRPLAERPAAATVVDTFERRECVPPADPAPFTL